MTSTETSDPKNAPSESEPYEPEQQDPDVTDDPVGQGLEAPEPPD
jgi:hypothetical protein